MKRIYLTHDRAAGDIVVMTALIRDLAKQFPNDYQIAVKTSVPSLWEHNPYVRRFPQEAADLSIKLDYGSYMHNKLGQHFLRGFHHNFEQRTGVAVSLLEPKPDLHLSDAEKGCRLVSGEYWVMMAGGKTDFTIKHWPYANYQKTADTLQALGIKVVQAGASSKRANVKHVNARLERVQSLVGQTDFRQFMGLVYHAQGVICPVTSAMHIAAAFDKPCVVIAGGREEYYWEAYTNEVDNFGPIASRKVAVPHRFLYALPEPHICLEAGQYGCWKNKIVRPPKSKDSLICRLPTKQQQQDVASCMAVITPERVVESVLSYYYDGTL